MITVKEQQSGYGMSRAGQAEGPPHRKRPLIQPNPIAGESSPAASPVNVLIVEDSIIVRERLAALVADLRNVAIVGHAGDGFQAKTLFRQHRPDAVVLDIQLPGINGLDLLAQFKRKNPACVVIVLTTYAFKEIRQRCVALGADYFFDKCSEFERVIEVLSMLPARGGLSVGN
jgi:DNA-binding NarL/FixJ family response regulator